MWSVYLVAYLCWLAYLFYTTVTSNIEESAVGIIIFLGVFALFSYLGYWLLAIYVAINLTFARLFLLINVILIFHSLYYYYSNEILIPWLGIHEVGHVSLWADILEVLGVKGKFFEWAFPIVTVFTLFEEL